MYSKISVLAGIGGNRTGIGDYFHALDAAGIPAVIASYADYGVVKELLEFRRASGVPHICAFKPLAPGGNPDYEKEPEIAAQEFWDYTVANLPPEYLADDFAKENVWLILWNEGRREVTWEDGRNGAAWWARAVQWTAQKALEGGYRVLFWGWSAGTPDIAFWNQPEIKEVLKLFSDNINRLGIAVHEGADPALSTAPIEDLRLINNEPYIAGRFKWIFDVCDQEGYRRPRIFISECAWRNNQAPPPTIGEQDIDAAIAYYAQFPEVLGLTLWTTLYGPEYANVHNEVAAYIPMLKDKALNVYDGVVIWPDNSPYYAEDELDPDPPVDPDPDPDPTICVGLPRVQYKRVVNVCDPAYVNYPQLMQIFQTVWPETVTNSFDDAGIGDLVDKKAKLWNIPTDRRSEFLSWFDENYPGTVVEFHVMDINGPSVGSPPLE